MPALRILREAAEELDAAAAYLETQRPGYAALFLDAYEDKLGQLAFRCARRALRRDSHKATPLP